MRWVRIGGLRCRGWLFGLSERRRQTTQYDRERHRNTEWMLSHVATPPRLELLFFQVQFCGSYTARVRERQGQCKFQTTLSCGACRTRAHFPWTCRWHPLFRRCRRILVHGLEALLILTEHFCQSPFRLQYKWQMRGPGLRVRLRVVDGDVVH